MNIVLIGYRGSGKSAIGTCLAARLSLAFVDTDGLIVQRAGKTIREIFEGEGETGFRAHESDVIRDVATTDRQVIALGGGAVLRAENIAALRRHPGSKIVWLQAAPDVLYRRIAADTATSANRPNLTAAGGLGEVKRLLAARTPLYHAAADVAYDVSDVTVEQAAAQVMKLLRL
jgi:shikimate kinase